MIEEIAHIDCSETCPECGERGEHETIIEISADEEAVPGVLDFGREQVVHFPVRWLRGGHPGFWSVPSRRP